MLRSSGTRSVFAEAARWAAAAVVAAIALVHFDELRALTATLLERAAPAEVTEKARDPDTASMHVGGLVEIRASHNGHFNAEVEINGRRLEVMVDTGATAVALTYEDAERAGIFLRPSDFTHTVQTGNGVARVAPVVLDRVSIGDITVRNVRAAVSERGRLPISLLGMTFLSRLSRFDMRSGTLLLQQ